MLFIKCIIKQAVGAAMQTAGISVAITIVGGAVSLPFWLCKLSFSFFVLAASLFTLTQG